MRTRDDLYTDDSPQRHAYPACFKQAHLESQPTGWEGLTSK